MRSVYLLVGLLVLFMYGCGGEERAGLQAARPDSVAIMLAQLTPETFDTVSWASDSAAVARGAVVWTYSCRKCHGDFGHGDGNFVQHGDTLRPRSFLAPDWHLAGNRDGVRQAVFTGTNEGMPHWSVHIKPRDVDAVSYYVTKVITQ
jgi:mono/diheme cytochrome c family protein